MRSLGKLGDKRNIRVIGGGAAARYFATALVLATVGLYASRASADQTLKDTSKNLDHDASCMCFGDGNELNKVFKPGEKAQADALKDLTQGPGAHNDLVGRKGWVRQRLGF